MSSSASLVLSTASWGGKVGEREGQEEVEEVEEVEEEEEEEVGEKEHDSTFYRRRKDISI